MLETQKFNYLQIALLLGIMVHGVIIFFTFEQTYDAYVHIFFASHYAENWFDTWNYKWYTGFTMTSYPPLIHQLIALLSMLIGLKGGFIFLSICSVLIFIRGVYVFSKLWVDKKSAGIASIAAVFASSYIEALHIFGQLPSITGIAVLLNLCPYIYKWIRYRKKFHLFISLVFFGVITSIHHVTTIFGMVFFVFPVMGLAVMDNAAEEAGSIYEVRFGLFVQKTIKSILPAGVLGFFTGIVAFFTLMPYWLWSRSDPITQVPIPHGSRDSFIDVFSSGLVFFLIPWGMVLFMLPFIFRKVYHRRTIFLALSFSLAFILGTGGTTPIPKILLGENAFNILTLDRFTYWATIMALPFVGYFFQSLLFGQFGKWIKDKFGQLMFKATLFFWILGFLFTGIAIVNIGYFQPLQPQKIDIQPILNFLERDQHDQWRYLTLGFGDQVAWLSANTDALTVDGNYHSVRRLPELTTREVERLENAKYLGTEGIAALHQFLTIPEKYNLKYIFNNDQFYNPILYFSGWQKLIDLENSIAIWEKPDIPRIPSILPRKDLALYQRVMWGTIPLFSLLLLILVLSIEKWRNKTISKKASIVHSSIRDKSNPNAFDHFWWIFLLIGIIGLVSYKAQVSKDQYTPDNLIKAYFNAIDYKNFTKAFNFYDPENAPTIEEMLLDLSSEDGLILSYAKLNNLYIKTEFINQDTNAKVRVKAEWLTSISTFTTYHNYDVINKKGKWWIKFSERDFSTPPDQFISNPAMNFKNQGKRNIKDESVSNDDLLDRPEVLITEANLIREEDKYYIVGHIINTDNVPAYVSINAILYDENNEEIINYNCREVTLHNLLPKEKSYFRIDFEDMAYQISKINFPIVFDPLFSNPFEFITSPHHFVVNVKSTVSSASFYPYLGISDMEQRDSTIFGNFVNSGSKECNIPQLLVAYFEKSKLLWVESQFLDKGVRPRRYKPFNIYVEDLPSKEIIVSGSPPQLLTNGQTKSNLYQKWEKSYQKSKFEMLGFDSLYLVDIIPSGYVKQE